MCKKDRIELVEFQKVNIEHEIISLKEWKRKDYGVWRRVVYGRRGGFWILDFWLKMECSLFRSVRSCKTPVRKDQSKITVQ